MTDKSLTRRNLLSGSAGLAAGAVLMTGMNASAAGLEESLEKTIRSLRAFSSTLTKKKSPRKSSPFWAKRAVTS